MSLRASMAALLSILCCTEQAAATSEYELKAAYVYNFAKFIDWPVTPPLANFNICVYGKDPFGGFLDQAVLGKQVHGAPIVIRRIPPGQENWDGCQTLFLGATRHPAQIEPLLRGAQDRSILTISESDGFAEKGGMIGLRLDQGRVVFEINLAAISSAHLHASSRLVELGRVVGSRK